MFLLVDLVGSYKMPPEVKKRAQELRLKLEQEAVKKVRGTLPPLTQARFCTPRSLQQAEICSRRCKSNRVAFVYPHTQWQSVARG